MNRSKRKHTTTGKCRCSRCEAIAAGKTPAEADADYRKWEQANMQNHGWIIHFVAQGDESSPTGFTVIAEIERWRQAGESCFSKLLRKLKLKVPDQSIQDARYALRCAENGQLPFISL